jgi:hypothetical protein
MLLAILIHEAAIPNADTRQAQVNRKKIFRRKNVPDFGSKA